MGENCKKDRRLSKRLRRRQYGLNCLEAANEREVVQHETGVAGPETAEKHRDQLLRMQAEFDNYRKRVQRDQAQKFELANRDLLEQLLPVVDNFDRAMSNPGDSVEALLSGIQMVRKQLVDTLEQNGLKQIPAKGNEFDPNLHEAVATGPADEHPENHVMEVFQEGYTLKGKLVRPAMVKVARG